MKRHFTATAFVVHRGKTLLHWHRKLEQWMPPGGHLLPDEDPVTGVLREVREETGIEAELLPLTPTFSFAYPRQLPAPYTILVEDSAEASERHQHIDLIYFCRPMSGKTARPTSDDETLTWVSEDQLQRNEALPLAGCDRDIPVADDVRALALAALRSERELTGA
ncbi:MAG: NUDIX domain-containing protein [Chloroflexi bacterium]|nr:NUDIX domain-containing protein [Chloroflexota bacterium]